MRNLIGERPEEVRTPWFHAEFYMQSGVLKIRGLTKGAKGFHLVPGGVKCTLDLNKLKEFPRFFALLRMILDRWDPIPPPSSPPSWGSSSGRLRP